jgi:undecaprenyl diphosphate synthase
MNIFPWFDIQKTLSDVSRVVNRVFGIDRHQSMEIGNTIALNPARMPKHIARIMDGNGRWAAQRKLPRSAGHAAGTEALRAIIRECDALNIEALTIYAFSTENWSRPGEEIGALMALLLKYFSSEIDELNRKNVRIKVLGDIAGLPEAQGQAVLRAMRVTADNTGLKLSIALNYGGRQEIVNAAKKLALLSKTGEADPMRITESDFNEQLFTRGLPQVDLLIRTSGEKRLSNFLLFQTAYAEIIFNDALWPDYDVNHFHKDLAEFASRERRFGGAKEARS